jgi:hypothetical protein
MYPEVFYIINITLQISDIKTIFVSLCLAYCSGFFPNDGMMVSVGKFWVLSTEVSQICRRIIMLFYKSFKCHNLYFGNKNIII